MELPKNGAMTRLATISSARRTAPLMSAITSSIVNLHYELRDKGIKGKGDKVIANYPFIPLFCYPAVLLGRHCQALADGDFDFAALVIHDSGGSFS
jgi:hypothetical protein